MLDGIMVSGRLDMLTLNYERLASSAAPPGSDAAQYFALAATLASTTREAADVYDVDPATGTAKYEVVRSRTAELLDMINIGAGTSHRLPSR